MVKKKILERHVENSVVRHAKDNNFKVRKMNGMGYRSWPDRMFLYRKVCMFFIEFKRSGEVPNENQEREITELRRMGFTVYVVDNVKDGKRIIDKIKKAVDSKLGRKK